MLVIRSWRKHSACPVNQKKPRPVGGGLSHEKGPPLAGPDVDLDDVSACGGYSTPSSLKTCAVQVLISATDWLTDFTSDAVVRM
jgi:hypothetical protein